MKDNMLLHKKCVATGKADCVSDFQYVKNDTCAKN